jgi:hypothetical protein
MSERLMPPLTARRYPTRPVRSAAGRKRGLVKPMARDAPVNKALCTLQQVLCTLQQVLCTLQQVLSCKKTLLSQGNERMRLNALEYLPIVGAEVAGKL